MTFSISIQDNMTELQLKAAKQSQISVITKQHSPVFIIIFTDSSTFKFYMKDVGCRII